MQDEHTVLRLRTRDTIRIDGKVEIDMDNRVVVLPGEDTDRIGFEELKAVFFFAQSTAGGELAGRGSHVTVEFDDGELLSGFAPEYKPTLPGFYLYPENEDRVERIFVVASAIVSIDIDRL